MRKSSLRGRFLAEAIQKLTSYWHDGCFLDCFAVKSTARNDDFVQQMIYATTPMEEALMEGKFLL